MVAPGGRLEYPGVFRPWGRRSPQSRRNTRRAVFAPDSRLDNALFRATSGGLHAAPLDSGPHSGRDSCGLALVADDDDAVRELAATMLRRLGFRVATAGDGPDAVRIATERRGELVLIVLDLRMPGMDGAEVLDELDRRASDVPVIVASGYADDELEERFAGRRIAAILQKPYRYDDFVAVVRRATRRAG
jgi:CheY-like chemotaxis protein